MTRNIWIVVLLLALAACHSSPENQYYTLAPANNEPGKHTNIAISNVTIPGLMDRPQMIIESGSGDIEILEYKRWAEPLDTMIKRVLADDLNGWVSKPPVKARRISVVIDEFAANKRGLVILRAKWTEQSSKTIKHYAFDKSESADYHDIKAVVATMNHLLSELADSIKHKSSTPPAP